jgi:hypothetical protein
MSGAVVVAVLLSLPVFSRETPISPAGAQSAAEPRVWEDDAIGTVQIPLADPQVRVTHLSAADYYRLPVRPIYESYPIYAPGREPAGYLEELKTRVPRLVESSRNELAGEEAWQRFGALVFEAPLGYDDEPFSAVISFENTRDLNWYRTVGVRVDPRTGVMPYARYVVRAKGKIEVGNLACAMCHTRILDDGTAIRGAQGNFPFDRSLAFGMREAVRAIGNVEQASKELRAFDSLLFAMPWRQPAPVSPLGSLTLQDYIAAYEAIPPGVAARHGTSPLLPVQIPDLIGVQDRRYFDRTGLLQHRDAGDLMRYAALNQGADFLTRYGTFVPGGATRQDLPQSQAARYGDLQLRALARFVYALRPPTNPHVARGTEARQLAARGESVFQRLRCGRCHPPPAYTSNVLTPVDGFEVPSDHPEKYRTLEESVGTDPRLSLDTRRGTGYYKVPSIRGVWYRGPFEHNGSVATLEDWFDPQRLRDSYEPTGWTGPPGRARHAVTGHRFGLNLSSGDRRALIAFLKTL